MPRVKAAEVSQEKAPAKRPPHPLFPLLDASRISALWLSRLVRPKAGAKYQRETLASVEPSQITSDAHIMAHGPGVLELVARDATGQLLGDAYTLRVRDERGRVPELVTDFEDNSSGGLAAPGPAEDVGRMYRGLFDEMKGEFKRIREEDNAQHARSFEFFQGLMSQSISAFQTMLVTQRASDAVNGAPAQLPASQEPPAWFRSELSELRKAHEADRAKRMELELELAKLKVRRDAAAESGGGRRGRSEFGLKELIELAPTLAPIVRDFFRSEPSPAQLPGAHAAPSEPVVEAIEVDGVRLPSVGALRAIAQANAASHARGEPRDFLSAEALAAVASVRHRLPPDYLAAVAELTAPA